MKQAMRSVVKLTKVIVNKTGGNVDWHMDCVMVTLSTDWVRQQGGRLGREIDQGGCTLEVLGLTLITRISHLVASTGAFAFTLPAPMASFWRPHGINEARQSKDKWAMSKDV